MKTLKLEDQTAKSLYKTANSELKTILEQSFGKEFFSTKITDRIKTWQDILDITGLKEDEILTHRNPRTKKQRATNADDKIQLITEVFNEGWIADFKKDDYKYYPYFKRELGGWSVFSYGRYGHFANVGFGLYYKNSELALYAGNQFLDIYKDYLPE